MLLSSPDHPILKKEFAAQHEKQNNAHQHLRSGIGDIKDSLDTIAALFQDAE